MKFQKLLLPGLLIISLFSCNSHKPDMAKVVNDFADVECRAILLREKRFALANEIRFSQDTLMNKSKSFDSVRLQKKIDSLNQQKSAILQTSLTLADSIKTKLDSLMHNQLKSEKLKAAFNEMLIKELSKRGCK